MEYITQSYPLFIAAYGPDGEQPVTTFVIAWRLEKGLAPTAVTIHGLLPTAAVKIGFGVTPEAAIEQLRAL